MRLAKLVAAVVMASLLVATTPVCLWAADGTAAVPGIRASIDRSVAKDLATHQPDLAARPAQRHASAASRQMGGGGGGKSMAIVALISTVGGLAATYYIIKQTRKQTSTGQ